MTKTSLNPILEIVNLLESKKELDYYIEYFKKREKKFSRNANVVKKIRKFLRDRDTEPMLRFRQVFSEVFILEVLEKHRYDYLIDYKNKKNGKDVDSCIEISKGIKLLLEVYTPWENKWLNHLTDKSFTRKEARGRNFRGPWREDYYAWRDKMFNEVVSRMNKFAEGNYYKFLLFNMSDFGPNKWDVFWDRYIETDAYFNRGKHKEEVVDRLEKRRNIKKFYSGVIFLSIIKSEGVNYVEIYYKLFTNKDKYLKKFIGTLLKEDSPRELYNVIRILFTNFRDKIRLYRYLRTKK